MASQIVPLTTNPNQTFAISLNVNNAVLKLNLALRYNEMANYWVMSIRDVNGVMLLDSVPLITGVWPASNILQQFQYLAIGSAYLINLGGDLNDYPTADDLGSTFVLLWSDNV